MKKKFRALVVFSFLILGLFLVSSCDTPEEKSDNKITDVVDNKDSNNKSDDYRYSIYLSAVQAGYNGNYEEWLSSIKGASVELRVNATHIQMKYSDQTEWTNLISLASLKGSDGVNGTNGIDGADGKSAYDIAVDLGFNGTQEEWLASLVNANAKEIEFYTNENNVLWRYKDESEWKTLISLDSFKCNCQVPKSAYDIAVELGFDGTEIEWVESLVGEKGKDGIDGKSAYDIAVEAGFDGTEDEWLDSLAGKKGESAYELYVKYHPEYTSTEEEWVDDLINLRLNKRMHKVNFIVDGKTVLVKNYFEDSYYDTPFVPTKDGYYCLGWFEEFIDVSTYNGAGTIYFPSNHSYNNEINLVAAFTQIEYDIDFRVDGALVKSDTINVIEINGRYDNVPSTPVKNGYSFDGWYFKDIKLGESYLSFNNNFIIYLAINSNIKELEIDAKFEANEVNDYVDVYINHLGKSGISYLKDNYYNPIDKTEYVSGSLLPTWSEFAKNLNMNIRDASGYRSSNDSSIYNNMRTSNFASETDPTQKIDLFCNTVNNIKNMGYCGEAVDLTQYIDNGYMPNFKQFLDNNPEIRSEITIGDAIYYTPYFDSYNELERCLIMDTSIVELVLDDINASFDNNLNNGKNGVSNVITDVKYKPFINADYNYPNDTTVKVLYNGVSSDLTIKKTSNIIKIQNELLEVGCTGKALAQQFIAYLNDAFGDNVGEGKIYSKLSEIFTSGAAAYNVDELIALMRVVKANPGLITGDENAEVETLFPRENADNRISNILQFAQIWGVQGLTSAKDFLYFLQNGRLYDARTTQATYDALDCLAALYSEGLILTDFWYKDTTKIVNFNKYFSKTTPEYGFGLLEYDYIDTQSIANDCVNGIGTRQSSRVGYNSSVTGIMPILPPLTMWANGIEVTSSQSLNDFTGKTLMRHYDDNRIIKTNAWCIPATSDNIMDAIKLMDYLYSPLGTYIQCFGPSDYWENANDVLKNPDSITPILSEDTLLMLENTGTDFYSFMKNYIGATFYVGHVKPIELQLEATNYYSRSNYEAIINAIKLGVVDLSLVNKDGDNNPATVTWNTTVPKNNYESVSVDLESDYEFIIEFWSYTKKASINPSGWVYAIANGGWSAISETDILGYYSSSDYTKSDIILQEDKLNEIYLSKMAESLNNLYGVSTF